jgi:hypothetical protein
MIRRHSHDDRQSNPVNHEREILQQRLGDEKKYFLSYLGGGDFLVHVIGIDREVDRIYAEARED